MIYRNFVFLVDVFFYTKYCRVIIGQQKRTHPENITEKKRITTAAGKPEQKRVLLLSFNIIIIR